MATEYKILGQVTPNANTLTNVYITGASTQAIIGTITINNLSDSNAAYSLVVRPSADSFDTKHYIIRGGVVPARELVTITGAVAMNSSVVLAANTNSGSLTFNAYGAEIV